MADDKLARELLDTARSDLKALENMLDPEAFDDRVFGFHAQQAVEKALKAWLSILQCRFPFTHDLSLLLHTLEEQGADVESCWQYLDLSDYAVRFRYGGFPDDEEALERRELATDVAELIARVEALLLQA